MPKSIKKNQIKKKTKARKQNQTKQQKNNDPEILGNLQRNHTNFQ